jgi:hypothetical protein
VLSARLSKVRMLEEADFVSEFGEMREARRD